MSILVAHFLTEKATGKIKEANDYVATNDVNEVMNHLRELNNYEIVVETVEIKMYNRDKAFSVDNRQEVCEFFWNLNAIEEVNWIMQFVSSVYVWHDSKRIILNVMGFQRKIDLETGDFLGT